jgi:DNA-binding protein H-NS
MKMLKSMTYKELIALRFKLDATIRKRDEKEHRDIAKMVEAVHSLSMANANKANRRGHALKGRKLKPKYRNPADRRQTWAGRGHQPRWLRAELKSGKKLATFLIK